MKDQKLKNIVAVIMAGGKSSRMGKDKSLLKFSNFNSMAEYQYNKLTKIFEEVYMSAKTDKFDFLDSRYLIIDNSNIFSPMVALDSIFKNIDRERIFIISVDMPLVSSKSICKLIESSINLDNEVVIAKDKDQNRHSLCGVFNRSIHTKIKCCLDNDIHRINYLINSCNYKELLFEDYNQFININTPEQYEVARKYL